MEKFALLDFLKAFQTIAANSKAEKDAADPPLPQQQPTAPPSVTAPPERNPMADVIARHEEIANRIKNNRR